MKLLKLIAVLERIACALEILANHFAPSKPTFSEPNLASSYPPLGITTADNETTAKYEDEEEAQIKSKEEKLLKEYKEYLEWRERNVR